jgi:hypothetical protein
MQKRLHKTFQLDFKIVMHPGTTVVEHPPRHLKAKGSSPAPATGTGRKTSNALRFYRIGLQCQISILFLQILLSLFILIS